MHMCLGGRGLINLSNESVVERLQSNAQSCHTPAPFVPLFNIIMLSQRHNILSYQPQNALLGNNAWYTDT